MNLQYKQIVSKIFIKEYVARYGRVPNDIELAQHLLEIEKAYPAIDFYGASGSFSKKYNFLERMSSSLTNSNMQLLAEDVSKQEKEIKSLVKDLDINKSSLKSYLKRSSTMLSSFERRLNNLLINYSNSDIFLHSIDEDFLNHNNVDLKNSSVDFFKGYCTLYNKKEYMDLNNISASFAFRTNSKKISEGANCEVKEILTANGKEWIAEFITSESSNRVVLEIELDLMEADGVYVGSLILEGSSIEKNGKLYYGTQVQCGNKSYKSIEPRIKRFSSGENFTNINQEGVRKIKISLIKETFDHIKRDSTYSYVFNLSKIKIRKDFFTSKEGIMYAGPYEIRDGSGNLIPFSMAKLSSNTCCIVPDETSANFYLSVDNVNWHEAFWKENQNVIRFDNLNLSSEGEIIDNSYPLYSTIEIEGEYYLNYRIDSSLLKRTSKNNIILKRNIKQDKILYGADSGWFYDRETTSYKVSVEIKNIEGKYLDLGNDSAIIDGFKKSGLVKLEKGIHEIEIAKDRYFKIEKNLVNDQAIQEKDSFYPYNQKHLIEGYEYSNNFAGEKIYLGFEDVFSFKMEYIPEEKFYFSKSLKNYTIIEKVIDNNTYSYFKVNVLEADSSWRQENNRLEIIGSLNEYNKLYVKAVIRSSDNRTVPHINSFNIRVI